MKLNMLIRKHQRDKKYLVPLLVINGPSLKLTFDPDTGLHFIQ